MQLTGTETHDCTDKDTCVLACLSNPNCANPLYSDGFWEAILSWSDARKAFDAKLSQFGSGLGAITNDTSAIDSKISTLSELSALAQIATSNSIFLNRTDEGCSGANATRRCFEYCKKIDYSVAGIASQSQNLLALKNALLEAQKQPARAAAILNASSKNDKYVSTRGADFAALRIKMGNGLAKLNSSALGLSTKVNDPQIGVMLNSLSALSEKIEKAGAEGRYKTAFSLKPEYENAVGALLARIASDQSGYDLLLVKIDASSGRANNSSWLIGKETYEVYATKISLLKSNLTSAPATLQQISETNSQLNAIDESIVGEISTKASQGGAHSAQKGILPCMPALVALVAGLFVLLRR